MESSWTLLRTIAAQPALENDIPDSPINEPPESTSAISTTRSRTEFPRFLAVTNKSITSPGDREALPPPSSIVAE